MAVSLGILWGSLGHMSTAVVLAAKGINQDRKGRFPDPFYLCLLGVCLKLITEC